MVAAKAQNWWKDLPAAARAGVYAAGFVTALFGGVALGDGSIPQEAAGSRFTQLEGRVAILEQVARYQGCRAFLQDKGRDPAECSELYKYLEAFLTDPAGVP